MREYEGDKDYIFISYSHRNEDTVLRIVDRLCKDGYRVWYDAGIEVGTEWPENIATHLMNCSLFVAFISSDYLDSFNCKREIDYAVSKRKNFITVWLEQAKMSPGMEMQLSSVQSITWNPKHEEEFFEKLYKSGMLDTCKEETADTGTFQNSPAADSTASLNNTESVATSTIKRTNLIKETNKVKKDKKQDSAKKELSGKGIGPKIKKVLLGILIAIASIIVVAIIVSKANTIKIAGEKVSRLENNLLVKSAELTDQDVKKIAKLKKLEYLTFEECTFPSDASQILKSVSPKLALIKLINSKNMTDYSWISGHEQLSSLEISGCNLTDESLNTIDFSSLPKTRCIYLPDNTELTSIAPLSGCGRIGILNLENTAISDLSAIQDKETLSRLNISSTNISDLSVLSDFTGLTEVYAADNGLTALSGLDGKKDLSELVLNENKLTTLDGLESLYNLTLIAASGNNLTSIDGLSNCTRLKTVDLDGNKLQDVSALSKSIGTIENLSLSDNQLTDLSVLTGMTSLKAASLNNNKITDLSFASMCQNLQRLGVNSNEITSLEPLYGLQNLRYLHAANNKLSGTLKLEEMPELSDVLVQHNSINEITYNSEATETFSYLKSNSDDGSSAGKSTSTRTILLLAAYDNPLYSIKDVIGGQAQTSAMNKIYTGYLSFPSKEDCIAAGYDYSPYSFGKLFSNIYISDCPYDERLQLEESMSYPNVEYTTIDHMDELLQDKINEDIKKYFD